MNRTMIAVGLTMAFLVLGSCLAILPADAAGDPWIGDITICSDGSISPSNAPRKVSGCNYKMKDNVIGTITIDKDDVTLNGNGYRLYGPGYDAGYKVGVNVSYNEGIMVKNMIIEDFRHGINLLCVNDSIIKDNMISGVLNGIRLDSSNDNIIRENTISELHYGIALRDCDNNNIVLNGIFGKNSDYPDVGIGFWEGCDENMIKDNMIYDLVGTGIYLQTSCNENMIKNNLIENCGWGIILVDECSYNTIRGNVITTGTFGILFYYDSCFNKVIDNWIEDFYGAIAFAFGSGYNLVKLNYFYQNEYGIDIEYADNNTYRENIVENGTYAFFIEEAFNNVIFHNDIIDYEFAFDTVSYWGNPGTSELHNTWDNGKGEGNYWDDYTGSDTDGDGIGDTDLPHNGVDNYPLTSRYN